MGRPECNNSASGSEASAIGIVSRYKTSEAVSSIMIVCAGAVRLAADGSASGARLFSRYIENFSSQRSEAAAVDLFRERASIVTFLIPPGLLLLLPSYRFLFFFFPSNFKLKYPARAAEKGTACARAFPVGDTLCASIDDARRLQNRYVTAGEGRSIDRIRRRTPRRTRTMPPDGACNKSLARFAKKVSLLRSGSIVFRIKTSFSKLIGVT